MEFSKYLGAAEECSSSESGWTTYIVSPMHETDANHHHNHHHHYHHRHHQHHHGHDYDHVYDGMDEKHGDYNMYHDEDSDDSMVSDASSAPSRQEILRESSKRRSGLLRVLKRAMNKDSLSKNQKQVEKKLYDKKQRAVKEEGKTRIDIKARKTN